MVKQDLSVKRKRGQNDRLFLRTSNREHIVLSAKTESAWVGEFSFVQLADPQFGMLNDDESWEEEQVVLSRAIKMINSITPRPRFVVVCGDLVNAFPDKATLDTQNRQVADFKHAMHSFHLDIELVCLCGNHDVGNRPNPTSIQLFQKRFGEDYFTFWVGGVQFLVLNSAMYADGTNVQALRQEQDLWLADTLAKRPTAKAASCEQQDHPIHRVVFSHHPPFIFHPNEEDGYFNLAKQDRFRLMDQMVEHGVSKWFCGHYHRNAGGVYRCGSESSESGDVRQENDDRVSDTPELEVVVTGAVGCTIVDDGTDPLGTSGISSIKCDGSTSGFRVVTVSKGSITHKWFTLDAGSQGVHVKQDTASVATQAADKSHGVAPRSRSANQRSDSSGRRRTRSAASKDGPPLANKIG